MTLNNANITLGRVNEANIYIGIPVTIVLEGKNTLSGKDKGISASKPITIKGRGTLIATGSHFGIQAEQGLTISDNVNITASGDVIGIEVDSANSLSITNSIVNATGKGPVGIYAFNSNLTISGSEVTDNEVIQT